MTTQTAIEVSPKAKRKAESQLSRQEQEKSDKDEETLQKKIEELEKEDLILEQIQNNLEKEYPAHEISDEQLDDEMQRLEAELDKLSVMEKIIDK
jgi:ribosomal protein L9